MKRCGSCGRELKMRPFSALSNTCEHCGQSRYSKAHDTRVAKAKLILLGFGVCVILDILAGIPAIISVPLLLVPFSAFVCFRYDPLKDAPDEEQDVKRETDESSAGCDVPRASIGNRLMLLALSLLVAAAIWIPAVHLPFKPQLPPPTSEAAVEPLAEGLAAAQVRLWVDPALRKIEVDKMRSANAEWDFMGRSFLVWALAERCLHQPELKAEYLPVMDRIIDHTLQTERDEGLYHFLMPYARRGPFVQQPPRSQFLDGEISLMLGVRCLIEDKPEYRPLLAGRVETNLRRMKASPVLCTESYPDECWMFCNTVALAAVRVADKVQGTDNSDFFRQWVKTAKENLVHEGTGLLVSSFTYDGQPLDGPEGSSIWMSAHCLRLIDEEFARDQYRRARKEIGVSACGMAYAREWPESWQSPMDVDSGPIIPILDASAGSSGLAFVAARSFDDREYFQALQTSVDFAGFPIEEGGRLKYAASNQVGDAVLLYSAVLGPVWEKVQEEAPR